MKALPSSSSRNDIPHLLVNTVENRACCKRDLIVYQVISLFPEMEHQLFPEMIFLMIAIYKYKYK